MPAKITMPTGDPRMPDKIVVYNPPKVNPDDLPFDLMGVLSLLFGIGGMMLKNKISAWLALFTTCSSIAQVRPGEVETRQMMATFTAWVPGEAHLTPLRLRRFAIMGLTSCYGNGRRRTSPLSLLGF